MLFSYCFRGFPEGKTAELKPVPLRSKVCYWLLFEFHQSLISSYLLTELDHPRLWWKRCRLYPSSSFVDPWNGYINFLFFFHGFCLYLSRNIKVYGYAVDTNMHKFFQQRFTNQWRVASYSLFTTSRVPCFTVPEPHAFFERLILPLLLASKVNPMLQCDF